MPKAAGGEGERDAYGQPKFASEDYDAAGTPLGAKPTPGPWEVRTEQGGLGTRHVVGVYGTYGRGGAFATVAVIPDGTVPMHGAPTAASKVADARLISAAPELAASLVGLLGEFLDVVATSDACDWDNHKVVVEARAALLKAGHPVPAGED